LINILTHHNNFQRTGANIQETILTTQNVKVGSFGKLWEYPVRGRIYAQPLYATLLFPSLTHVGVEERHFIYIATAENFVYAFDADSGSSKPFWRFDAGSDLVAYAGRVFLDDDGVGHGQDITPVIGITGTPVIDLPHFTMYFVAMTQLKSDSDSDNDEFLQTLHALDIRTGALRSKVNITGDIEGGGTFNPRRQNQRAALALVNDRIYIAWAGFGDIDPYDGLIMSYSSMDSSAPLKKLHQFQVARFEPTVGPRHKRGGIWHSGGGPAIDDSQTFLYVVTGNGNSSNDHAGTDFDSSAVKLDLDLNVVDYYTPSYQNFLNENDLDLSVSGPMIPADQPNARNRPTKLLLHGSKAGLLYVLNRDNLGKFSEDDNHIIQSLRVFPDADDIKNQMTPSHMHTVPVYWHAPDGPRVYIASDYNLGVRAFRFENEKLNPRPVARNFFPRAPITQMTLSSNGSASQTGILWFISSPTGTVASYPGIFYAFDAETLEMLFTSEANPFDHLGDYPRFTPPIIANGKAYVPTFSNKLAVYGLKP
jgi:outer membrane protein assembly factor BamB